MGGSPQGPWFSLSGGSSCTFNLTSSSTAAMSCPITLYSDELRQNVIGSGLLSASSLSLSARSGSFQFVGGSMSLSTSISQTPANIGSGPSSFNYHSQSGVSIYFQAKQTMPASGAPMANGLSWSNSNSAQLTLWGSNGWDSVNQAYDLPRTTGFDFQASLTCAPSVPPTPPTPPGGGHSTNGTCVCNDVASSFVATTAALASGPISYTAHGTCLRLSFSA